MANEVDYNPCQYLGNGLTRDFSFDWKLIEPEELIVTLELVSTGNETTLIQGSDYTLKVNRVGGSVTLTTAPSEDYYVNIRRKTSNYQSKGYSTTTGFQGDEIEKSFDKVSCCLQDMQYGIDTFKDEFTAEITDTIQTNKDEVDAEIDDFENEVNSKIEQVNNAVAKLNRLDEVLEECETYATNANNYSLSAEEQSTIAQQQALVSKGYAEEAEETLSTFRTEQESAIEDIQNQQNLSEEELNTLKNNLVNNIQALGVFMENDRLFYFDTNGIKHEFRNDFGGIAPMSIYNKDIQKVETGFALRWSDPNDSTYMDNVYCNWGGTLIVRKENSFPESPFDGSVILDCKTRNAYSADAYIDVCDNTKNYKYRAFPYSINKVYNLDDKNKFGVWIFGFTELLTEPDPAKRITYIEDNEYYSPQYMDFANDIFRYGDWENSPFNHYDWIRPVTLYNSLATDENGNNLDGQVFEYLDPNDHTKTIDGEVSHIADLSMNINCMVEKRKIFYKRTWEGNYYIFRASNEKLEGYECLNCLKADGTYNEFYYTPMYGGYLHNNVLRSMSGGLAAMSGKTGAQEWSYARANGADWFGELEVDEKLEEDIFKLLFKNTNSQAVLGNGVIDSSNALSGSGVSGRTDQKGPNYGTNGTNFPVKFRYRQNFYSYQWKRIGGHIVKNGVHYFKYTKHTGDGSTANDWDITGTTANGYVAAPEIPAPSGTSGGYQSGFKATKWGVFPTVHSGSSTTYTGDGGWFNNGIVAVVLRGGASYNGAICGAFCSSSDNAVSSANWYVGCSVSYRAS